MVSCGWLSPPAKGKKEGTSYLQGATVRFTCDDDYTLKGSEERVCQENGQWSGEEAACKVPRMNIWWNPAPLRWFWSSQISSGRCAAWLYLNEHAWMCLPVPHLIQSNRVLKCTINEITLSFMIFFLRDFFCVSENILQDHWLWLKCTCQIRNRKNLAPTPQALLGQCKERPLNIL